MWICFGDAFFWICFFACNGIIYVRRDLSLHVVRSKETFFVFPETNAAFQLTNNLCFEVICFSYFVPRVQVESLLLLRNLIDIVCSCSFFVAGIRLLAAILLVVSRDVLSIAP